MAQEEIWIDPKTQVPYFVNHNSGTKTRVGGESFARALKANQAQIQPQGKKATDAYPALEASKKIPVWGGVIPPVANVLSSIPREIGEGVDTAKEIFNSDWGRAASELPSRISKAYADAPVIPGASNRIPESAQKILNAFVQPAAKNTYNSLANWEEDPITAAVTAYGLTPSKSGVIGDIFKRRVVTPGENILLDEAAQTAKNLPLKNADSLAAAPISRAENLAFNQGKLGRTQSALELGTPSLETTQKFAGTAAGRQSIQGGKTAVADFVKAGEAAEGGTNATYKTIWRKVLKEAGTGEGGEIDPKAFKTLIVDNGKKFRKFITGEQATQLQQIGHTLDAVNKTGMNPNAALRLSRDGVNLRLAEILSPSKLLKTGVSEVKQKIGQTMSGRFTTEQWAELMADPNAGWLATRIAGKTLDNPSLKSDVMKLMNIAGKLGIKVDMSTPSHKLGREE